MTECPCSRPTAGWLCSTCIAGFCDNLTQVEAVMLRLETAKTGDTKPRNNGSSPSTSGSRAPVNLSITVRMLDIEVLLRALAGHVDSRWLSEPGWVGLADVIVNNVGVLAARPFVVQYAEQLGWELARARELLNPERERQLIGPCPEDDTPLTAPEDAKEVRCPTCGTTYDVGLFRLNRVLAALGDDGTPVRASEVVRRFTAAGVKLTAQNMKDWTRRGMLHPVSVDEHARRLFSIPDVYALITP